MNWKVLFHSVAAAAIGGALGAVTQYATDPCFTAHCLKHLGSATAAGALAAVLALLKQSPLAPKP